MKKLLRFRSYVTVFSLALVFSIAGPIAVHAATSPSLGGNSTYGIVSSTYTNSLNAGLETAITGDICHTGGIGGANPISISGANVVPCADARGTDQSTALADINSQGGCENLGVNVNLNNVTGHVTGVYAPGCYTSSGTMDITLSTTVTLNGAGTYIFRSGGAFTTGTNSIVALTGGASACDVFWAPVGHMIIGANSSTSATPTFVGNILQNSLNSFNVTLGHFVNLLGRVLAFGRTVTTDSNTITVPTGCTVASLGSNPTHLPPVSPLINVTKIPSPLNLPAGPGLVTYTYKVTNIGIVPVTNISVKDNMCSPTHFVSGDTNNDGILDLTETWTYNCFKTVSQTETNTVTACGSAANISSTGNMCDTAQATVVVGVPLTPPLIHLVKVPSIFVLPAGGGLVTYQYNITNPGTVPLSDVSISDDKCVAVRLASHAGDVNGNNLLDPGETWHFSCVSNLTQTTTNIGTAEGHANGFTAVDDSFATVVVTPPGVVVPKLPNTGLPPYGTSTPLDAALAGGILMMVLASLAVIQKKRKV